MTIYPDVHVEDGDPDDPGAAELVASVRADHYPTAIDHRVERVQRAIKAELAEDVDGGALSVGSVSSPMVAGTARFAPTGRRHEPEEGP